MFPFSILMDYNKQAVAPLFVHKNELITLDGYHLQIKRKMLYTHGKNMRILQLSWLWNNMNAQ